MPWFKVDDNLAMHPKALRAGNAAIGMWVRAGSWSAQQLSDGFVPDEMVVLLGGHATARKLVAADLWIQTEGGYQFHQWDERQPTRTHVEHERKAARTRKERWKERQENAVPDAVPNGGGTDAHARAATRPDPTRPVPKPENQKQDQTRGDVKPASIDVEPLVDQFVDACQMRPPEQYLDRLRGEVRKLIAGATGVDDIRGGLVIVATRGLQPSTLPGAVHEHLNARPRGRPSTTDTAVAQTLALRDQYADREAAEGREITR